VLTLEGIDTGGRCDLFRRLAPFKKGHSPPFRTKGPERSQSESLYAMSYFQQIGIELEFKCAGGLVGYAAVVCRCMWS